jgi:hypothetical protein
VPNRGDALGEATGRQLKEVVKEEVKEQFMEVRRELKTSGQLSFSTRALAEVYREALSTQLLQRVQLPTWFAPDAASLALTGTPLPGASEADVQQFFERLFLALAAASRAPTLVMEGRSSAPSFGTRKPDVVALIAAALALAAGATAAAAEPISRSLMHIAAIGELKLPRLPAKKGVFTDEEKGRALNFVHALVRAQPWRAHDGSLARVVVFLSDGAHIVFFECTFRVQVQAQALHVELHGVRESASLPLDGEGGAFMAGLTKAPLDALGCALPQQRIRGAPVELNAYLGMGATSVGFAGTWRGDAVVLKSYHASTPREVMEVELAALAAVADVSGVCQLRGQADGCLLLAPCGAVAYSLHAAPSAAPAVPAPAGLWSSAAVAAEEQEPPEAKPLRAPCEPALPGAAEFCDLLDALAGLHAAGWVHRDPRPANFFRDAAGRFFLADLGSAARIGDAAAVADGRPWAPQYGPLAVLRATLMGAPLPPPEPSHDFEQLARLVYAAQAREADTLPARDDLRQLCDWWEQRDASLVLAALLAAAAAASTGDAARHAFKTCIRAVLVR